MVKLPERSVFALFDWIGHGFPNNASSAARGQETTADNFRLDVNADGIVNRADYGIVKDSRRHSLP